MPLLAIETSCDDTCAAVLDGAQVLSNVISSQADHERYGGVVPEVASRHHLELPIPVLDAALAGADVDFDAIDGVAVTAGPGLIGALLVGLRGSFREVVAWALSCLFFGLMHGVNILLGAPAASTVSQIISSVMAGSTFYLLRRYFGSLIPAMILHGLFDLSIFVQSHSGSEGTLLALLDWPAGLIAVIAGLVVALRTDKGPKESYAKGATDVAPVPA